LDLRRDLLAASHGLGVAQYRSGNLLAALSTFSRALQLAEAGGAAAISAAGSSDDRRAVAAANLAVGEVLLHNGETEASIGKLRKAVDLYSAFAGVTVPLRDTTPAGYQRALRQIAASAPVDRREAMETDLAPFFP
jgi:tetratricopeptide (TPR) repeat protein